MDTKLRRWRLYLSILLAVSTIIWVVATVALRLFTSPLPASLSVPPDCLREPAVRLAQAGLMGQVTLQGDETLVVHVLPPAESPPDQAAQVVWSVFDAVAPLPAECPYQYLEVTVIVEGTRLQARVSVADLRAWAVGELDDTDLVERIFTIQEPLASPTP